MGKKKANSMQFWTVDEFKIFIKSVENKPRSVVMFNILFWTGMRSGEMLALTLNDFDFKANKVNVNKNFARHKRQDLILEPKTEKSKRGITIPESLSQQVQEYASKLVGYDPNTRLFAVTKNHVQYEMKRGCLESGMKKIRVHDLRHSHASLLIELGFSPLLISERLGHENVETTLEIYSHLYPNKQEQVAEKLQSFF